MAGFDYSRIHHHFNIEIAACGKIFAVTYFALNATPGLKEFYSQKARNMV